jgi:hypothetical protein
MCRGERSGRKRSFGGRGYRRGCRDSLGDVCDFERKKGFLTRTSQLSTLALELQTKELNARIARDQAMLVLQSFQPQPPPQYVPAAAPPAPAVHMPPPPPLGLTPAEIDEQLAMMPEFSAEQRKTISYILNARLREKGG